MTDKYSTPLLAVEDGMPEVIEFDPSAHDIISLELLLLKDENTIEAMHKQFVERGWCFLRFPQEVPKSRFIPQGKFVLGPEELDVLNNFFGLPMEEKKTFADTEDYGYSHFPHKEGIRFLTGGRLHHYKLPEKVKEIIKSRANILDHTVLDIVDKYFVPRLGVKGATIAHRADLPTAFGDQVGMLDVLQYFNEKTAESSPTCRSVEDVNCVPHFDPGLFSISFLSTWEGLQMYDPVQKTWFGAPINIFPGQEDLGVLWLGDAASRITNGLLKGGIHRVVYPRVAKPRLTAWYEVCTVEQVNQGRDDKKSEEGTVDLPNMGVKVEVKKQSREKLNNYIERYYGLSMRKVMRRSDQFNVNYSEDYKRNKPPL